jgi:hypothetical protein
MPANLFNNRVIFNTCPQLMDFFLPALLLQIFSTTFKKLYGVAIPAKPCLTGVLLSREEI